LVLQNRRGDLKTGKEYKFPPEQPFKLGSQSYRNKITLQALLMEVIFGKPKMYNKVAANIVTKSDRVLLLHVASHRRVLEIFNISDMNVAEFFNRNNQHYYAMCGKVQIKYRRSRTSEVAYILDEDATKWYLKTESNEEAVCPKSKFSITNGRYIHSSTGGRTNGTNGTGQHSFKISTYWPIRIRLNVNNQSIRVTTNRMVYHKSGKTVTLDSSECT